MTPPERPPHADRHSLAIAATRSAITTSTPALVTISNDTHGMWASANNLDAAHLTRYGIDVVLRAFAGQMRHHPDMYAGVYAYALALPDQGIAHLVDRHRTHTAIPLAEHPHNDPRVQAMAIEGLVGMLQAGPGQAPNRQAH